MKTFKIPVSLPPISLPRYTEEFLRRCPRVTGIPETARNIKSSKVKETIPKRLRLKEFPKWPCPCALKKIMSLKRSKKLYEGSSIVKMVKNWYALEKVDIQQHNKKNWPIINPPICSWHTLDEKSNFCYFMWDANPANKREYTQESVALLLGTSVINVHASEHAGRRRLKEEDKIIRKIIEDHCS